MFREISPESMPADAHREALASRVRELEQEFRVVRGDARLRHALRQLRHLLGRVRQWLGLAYTWYEQPPPEVAAAFPDLKDP